MTITASSAKSGPYAGNGANTAFTYDFPVLSEAAVVVTVTSAAGADIIQTLTTDYTVNLSTGTVTMVVPPASGELLTITRATSLTQEVDLQNRGAVNPETLERSLDKLTLIAQDFSQLLERSIKVGVSADSAAIDDLISDVTQLAANADSINLVADLYAGLTATAGEINVLDGVTASTAEINILDGVTATTAEINVLDGVTAKGMELVRAADEAAGRTALGLGTASTATTGTATGNVPVLVDVGGSPGFAALNGENLTGVNRPKIFDVPTWTSGSSSTIVHDMTAKPSQVAVSLVAKVDASGWNIGDEVPVGPSYQASGPGVHVGFDDLEIWVQYFATFPVAKAGGAFMAVANDTNWAIRVRAWL